MPPEDKQQPSSARQDTDESLRVERERTDATLREELDGVDEIADAVISKARDRADEVLAATRAKTDRKSPSLTPSVDMERVREDQVLREERADADEALRTERTEHVVRLAVERKETDKDLFNERARSDSALATRDEFLGIVSHDLRNMLAVMIGSAARIEQEVAQENAAQIVMHAQRIQRSGTRMGRLIGDLVDVASIEAGVLAVIREVGDPAQVVREAVDTFQAQALANGISIETEILPSSAPTAFDPARILQVLANLLSNAIKFTPANGRIVVRLERADDTMRFAVSDTGVGIPADNLELVFDRYHQVTKNDRRGLGLGLYISKGIVLGHGGRIWAESTGSKGSTFCFTLPITRA